MPLTILYYDAPLSPARCPCSVGTLLTSLCCMLLLPKLVGLSVLVTAIDFEMMYIYPARRGTAAKLVFSGGQGHRRGEG